MVHQGTLDAPACASGARRSDLDVYTDGRMFTLFVGDCLPVMESLDTASIDLIVTSPPYNLGKEYERRRLHLNEYLSWHRKVIDECCRVIKTNGSICWQVGNYVKKGEVWPLDILLHPMFKANGFRLRNRIVWHFRHGVHQTRRFSGRYEVVLWFTRSNSYVFDLDSVRVPQL